MSIIKDKDGRILFDKNYQTTYLQEQENEVNITVLDDTNILQLDKDDTR